MKLVNALPTSSSRPLKQYAIPSLDGSATRRLQVEPSPSGGDEYQTIPPSAHIRQVSRCHAVHSNS